MVRWLSFWPLVARVYLAADAARRRRLRANKKAAAFFDAQPPYYKRVIKFWVMSARQEPTRDRRMDQLIAFSARSERIPSLTSPGRKK